jgi:hypothetical protein
VGPQFHSASLDAAFELQGRCYSIVTLGFLERYLAHGLDSQRTCSVENTLVRRRAVLRLTELMRREIQFHSFSDSKRARPGRAAQMWLARLEELDDLPLALGDGA